jgi:uncharacterized protein YpmB
MSLLDQVLIGVLSVIAAAFLAYFIYAWAAGSSYSAVERQAISIAKAKAGLASAETFSIVTTDETTYSLTGQNASGKMVGVLIPKNGDQIQVVPLASGVPQSTISKTDPVSLGIYKGNVVWESNSSNDFKIFDFYTGKELK